MTEIKAKKKRLLEIAFDDHFSKTMMQRFIMVPPQHMRQPFFNFVTSNNIDIQGSSNQLVFGTNSATFSLI